MIFIVLITVTILTSLTIFSNPLSQRLPAHDSSMFQYFGYAMTNGKIIYTEIFDHKGPIIFSLNALGRLISSTVNGIWYIEVLFIFLFFLYVSNCKRN